MSRRILTVGEYRNRRRQIDAMKAEHIGETCRWTWRDSDGFYTVACGAKVTEFGLPDECPFCGRGITLVLPAEKVVA